MATYDPSQVVGTFLGSIVTGFQSIKAERDEEMWSFKTSTDGKTIRVKNLNKQGTITFTLQQNSPMNDVLAAASALDEATNAALGPFSLTDLNGTTVVFAANACIAKPTAAEFAKDPTDREWVLKCDNLQIFVGGIF